VVVLQFAIRRVSVLRMSGATDVILKLGGGAGAPDFPPSQVYCRCAKLRLYLEFDHYPIMLQTSEAVFVKWISHHGLGYL
jgi:hypothetical protein